MLAAGQPAHVVNTASVGGLLAGPFLSPYVVSKHAVVALSEALRDELAVESVSIGVSVLCPGALRTGIWRSERVRPTQLAHTRPASRADERGFLEGMGAHIDASADPSEIAPQVFAAVRDQRFWILPDRSFEPAIRQRMQGILDALN
jgi:short-subunit dehydrogenase